MSLPDNILCEYPEPGVEGFSWLCENVDGLLGMNFTITKEGRLSGGPTIHDDPTGSFNLTGNLKLYRKSEDGAVIFYLAYFEDGQLRCFKRPALIEFESPLHNPVYPPTRYYCEQLEPKNGAIFRITSEGRLCRIDRPAWVDLSFHGELSLVPAMNRAFEDDIYIACFSRGRLQSLEEIRQGSETRETVRTLADLYPSLADDADILRLERSWNDCYDLLDLLLSRNGESLSFAQWRCRRTGDRFYPWDHPVHGGRPAIGLTGSNVPDVPRYAMVEWDRSNLRLVQIDDESGCERYKIDLAIPEGWLAEMKLLDWPA